MYSEDLAAPHMTTHSPRGGTILAGYVFRELLESFI